MELLSALLERLRRDDRGLSDAAIIALIVLAAVIVLALVGYFR